MKKLWISIEGFLVTLKELKWSDNVKLKHLSNVPFLIKNVVTCKFLIYSAVKLDLLNIIIPFIKILEKNDVDISEYVDVVGHVRSRLETVVRRVGGFNFQELTVSLMDPSYRLSHWQGVADYRQNAEVQQIHRDVAQEGCQCLLQNFNEMFSKEHVKKVEKFTLFSMTKFRREVGDGDGAENFAIKYRKQLVDCFTNPISFTAKWKSPPEETNKTYTAEALCDEDELTQQITDYCLYVHRNFMDKNPKTQKPFTTQEVLLTMISENHPIVEQKTSFRVVVDYYLTQMITSASVERLMSSFAYLDTAYTQNRTYENTEKTVVTYKEMPARLDKFDLDTAVYIWSTLRDRRTPIPPPVQVPQTGKELIKARSDIIKSRKYKEKYRQRNHYMDRLDDLEEDCINFEATDVQELLDAENPDEPQAVDSNADVVNHSSDEMEPIAPLAAEEIHQQTVDSDADLLNVSSDDMEPSALTAFEEMPQETTHEQELSTDSDNVSDQFDIEAERQRNCRDSEDSDDSGPVHHDSVYGSFFTDKLRPRK